MRVLMFGWEFPPQISGGLGTACQGLVHALTQNKVDVLFVTPFDFSNGNTALPDDRLPTNPNPKSSSKVQLSESTSPELNSGDLKQIRVPSHLNPYNQPYESSTQKSMLSQWNYNPHKHQPPSITEYTHNPLTSEQAELTNLEAVYEFSNNVQHYIKDYDYDVIHAHDWMTFDAAIQVKQNSQKPLVVHIHSTEYDRAGENGSPIVYEIEKKGMELADRVIAVSERTLNTIVTKYSIERNKIEVIYNGVQSTFNGSFDQNGLVKKKFITFLGRVTSQKGPEYFVDAAYQVLQKYPEVHFIMGGAGDLLPSMMEKVASLKMSSRFHFTGFLPKEQVDRIWAITDVYVMPSVSEPFGITPLEAMRAGIPVIISRQSGVSEIVNQVIKVDYWNTKEIADAICDLLAQPKLINRLKTKSKKEVKKISWDSASKKIIRLYEKLALSA